MKVLVTGGTGTVGSLVAQELLARGAEVSVLTRHPDRAANAPAGVHLVKGDLLDVAAIRSVFAGMDAVFLLTALSVSELHEGLLAANGAIMAGVKRIAFLSVHRVDEAPHLPHFGAKIPVEIVLKQSGIPYTILRPNNFYQNDRWYKDVMLQHGVYPQPIGSIGLSRIDVRDIAEAAAIALTTDKLANQTLSLVGPDVWTGPDTAREWSKALGRPIAYGSEDMDAWEQQAAQIYPAWGAFDFRLMYEFFQHSGLKAGPGEVEALTQALGHPPRRYADFVAETAREWAR